MPLLSYNICNGNSQISRFYMDLGSWMLVNFWDLNNLYKASRVKDWAVIGSYGITD